MAHRNCSRVHCTSSMSPVQKSPHSPTIIHRGNERKWSKPASFVSHFFLSRSRFKDTRAFHHSNWAAEGRIPSRGSSCPALGGNAPCCRGRARRARSWPRRRASPPSAAASRTAAGTRRRTPAAVRCPPRSPRPTAARPRGTTARTRTSRPRCRLPSESTPTASAPGAAPTAPPPGSRRRPSRIRLRGRRRREGQDGRSSGEWARHVIGAWCLVNCGASAVTPLLLLIRVHCTAGIFYGLWIVFFPRFVCAVG
jgi:hypothetical protein